MGLIHCNLRVLMAERGLNIQKLKIKLLYLGQPFLTYTIITDREFNLIP